LSLCHGILDFIFRLPIPKQESIIEVEEKSTNLKQLFGYKTKKTGGANSTRHAIPCTPEQLSELAENIRQGKKTLAINQWEGFGTLFTRPVILRVRACYGM